MSEGRRIRVAYIINDVVLGGAQTLVLALAGKIDQSRFHPVVYYFNEYPDERSSLKERFESAGIELRYVGTGGKTSIRKAAHNLTAAFRADRPDIVHTHLVDATIAGGTAARIVGCRSWIIHEHQTHMMYSWKVRLAYRLLRSLAKVTLCYSPVIEKELFGSTCTLNSRITEITRKSYTIHNGVDIERIEAVRAGVDRQEKRGEIGIPADAFLITSVARLVPWKGQCVLLEAFGRIAHDAPNAHLCLVGEGPLESELRNRAQELGVIDRMHLLGARNDVYEILYASDVGCLALTYEGDMAGESIGIAGYEIMATGLPFIATKYPAAELTVTDGQNAILVQPKNSEALAEALMRLANDPKLRATLGENAAAFIRSAMNWSSLVPAYENLYERIS